MARIPIIGTSTGRGVSVSLDSQRFINMQLVAADSADAKSPAALVSTSGLKFLADYDGSNKGLFAGEPCRGTHELPVINIGGAQFSALLVITGDHIYTVDVNENAYFATGLLTYTYSNLHSIPAKHTKAIFAESPTQVLIVSGGSSAVGFARFMKLSSRVFSDPIFFDGNAIDYVPLVDAVYLAGYFIGFCAAATSSAPKPFQQLFYALGDADAMNIIWSALNFFGATATADGIRKLIVKNDHLWVFKQKTIPVFSPTGDANNPFAPVETATINVGCVDGNTVAQEGGNEGDHIYWVSDGLAVYQTLGATAERISNAFVERVLQDAIQNFNINGLAGISAYCCIERGHPLYKLSIPSMNTTLVWDALTKAWHERGWWNADTGQFECEVGWVYSSFNHLHIVGDRRFGMGGFTALYEMSDAFHSNQIQPLDNSPSHTAGTDTMLRWEITGAHLFGKNRERLFIGEIELEFERGFATATGQGADPKVALQVSRDGGRTFGNSRTMAIGKVGEYLRRCRFQANGSGYDIVLRISGTDPVAYKLIAAYAEIEAGA